MRRAYFITALLLSALAGTVTLEVVYATVSVPEFTVKALAHPYDVPATYSTDPYTGETITHPGYHLENKSIEVRIKNQAFTPYNDTNGHEVNLYYNVRVKGHFEENWSTPITYSESDSAQRGPQSNSEYTVLSLANYYGINATVDYQVEAFVGHFYESYYPPGHALGVPITMFQVDETSGWSSTQLLIFSENQNSPPPQDALTLNNQELLDIAAAIVATIIFVVVVSVIYRMKRK